MAAITLEQAAQWCGGQINPKYKDVTFSGANMDTRKLEPGQLFIALQGARDGHDFIPAAMEKGGIGHMRGLYSPKLMKTQIKSIDDLLMSKSYFGE